MTQDTYPNPVIDPDDHLPRKLAFLQSSERLKDTIRSGTTRSGRAESTAEHSWRLCLLVLLFEEELHDVDLLKLLKICILHDLGEAECGDTPAPLQDPESNRTAMERNGFQTLCEALPPELARAFLALWDDYAGASSKEAQLAKGLDKLETMLQHLLMPQQDAAFYRFNLTYGRDHTDRFDLTRRLRAFVDSGTRDRLAGTGEKITAPRPTAPPLA
ncbi:HD domain-containing protein [Roseibium sp. RKSG952]|nr:HD domain-containing protein [Roseibium sp. RKSG952]MTH96433.1 HD domain-containing protein [Roseibium sp. RKSG952]